MLQRILIGLLFAMGSVACDDGYLRGDVSPSPDGKSYFGVIDDNGGRCGPIKVDGKDWALPMGQVSVIEPGNHTIECGADMSFTIPSGVVFKFDYWGP